MAISVWLDAFGEPHVLYTQTYAIGLVNTGEVAEIGDSITQDENGSFRVVKESQPERNT